MGGAFADVGVLFDGGFCGCCGLAAGWVSSCGRCVRGGCVWLGFWLRWIVIWIWWWFSCLVGVFSGCYDCACEFVGFE